MIELLVSGDPFINPDDTNIKTRKGFNPRRSAVLTLNWLYYTYKSSVFLEEILKVLKVLEKPEAALQSQQYKISRFLLLFTHSKLFAVSVRCALCIDSWFFFSFFFLQKQPSI
jgi:hypothetical protein